jgi:hypothetical protein
MPKAAPHARMPPWVVAVILGFLALFILAIALAHVVLFPGIIVLAAVIYGIVPYRGRGRSYPKPRKQS